VCECDAQLHIYATWKSAWTTIAIGNSYIAGRCQLPLLKIILAHPCHIAPSIHPSIRVKKRTQAFLDGKGVSVKE
jgi:hypothetical protein